MPITLEKINSTIMRLAAHTVVEKDPVTLSWYRGMVVGLSLGYANCGMIDWDVHEEFCALVGR